MVDSTVVYIRQKRVDSAMVYLCNGFMLVRLNFFIMRVERRSNVMHTLHIIIIHCSICLTALNNCSLVAVRHYAWISDLGDILLHVIFHQSCAPSIVSRRHQVNMPPTKSRHLRAAVTFDRRHQVNTTN